MPFIPHTVAQHAKMLATIGASRFEELLGAIPEKLLLEQKLDLPPAHGEVELAARATALIAQNQQIPLNRMFAGGGIYPHHIPAVVDELARRGEFYTAYTPYQAEVSQGMLQCIYEYQSYICMLTGMEVSNASSYDGGTALADAVFMAYNHTKGKRRRVIFAPYIAPPARQVVATYGQGLQLELSNCPADEDGRLDPDALALLVDKNVAAVVFQYPDYLGYLDEQLESYIQRVHAFGALAIVLYYPYVAGIAKTPGELGADIVCGEAQCLGNPMGFGGPLLGFLACRESLTRLIPGRLVGRAPCERDGEPGEGFVMTLQAREQHIRRARATSNICSNEALLALRTCFYLGAIGRQGFTDIALLCHENAKYAHEKLCAINGVADYFPQRAFFNEFTLRFPSQLRDKVYDVALGKGILAGIKPEDSPHSDLVDALTFAFTEMHSHEDIDALARAIEEVLA